MLTWPSRQTIKEKLLRPFVFLFSAFSRVLTSAGDSEYRTQMACKPFFVGSNDLNNPIVRSTSTTSIITNICYNALVRLPQMHQHQNNERKNEAIPAGKTYWLLITAGGACLVFNILSAFNNILRLGDYCRGVEGDPNDDPLWLMLLSLNISIAQAFSFFTFILTVLETNARQIQRAINERSRHPSWRKTLEVEFKPANGPLKWDLTFNKVLPIASASALLSGIGCTFGTFKSFSKIPMRAIHLTPFTKGSKIIFSGLSGVANIMSTMVTAPPTLYKFFEKDVYPTVHSPWWKLHQGLTYLMGGAETLFNGMNVCNSFFFIVGGENNNYSLQDLMSLDPERTFIVVLALTCGGISALNFWTFNVQAGFYRVYQGTHKPEEEEQRLLPSASPHMNGHSRSVTVGYGTFDNPTSPRPAQNGHFVKANGYRV